MTASTPLNVARALMLEATAVEVQKALGDDGIRSLVIKGPVTSRWLYDDPRSRPYLDLDILVDPPLFDLARQILRRLGFEDEMAGVRDDEVASHARDFRRGAAAIDLHRVIPGLEGHPDAFERLWSGREDLVVAGGVIGVPGEVGRCLLLPLTAASAVGGATQPFADLERASASVAPTLWRAAAELADELGVSALFGQGLRATAAGRELADALRLPEGKPLPPKPADLTAAQLARLRALPGCRSKLGFLVRELVPSPAFLRYSMPLARRGAPGLLVAYALRPAILVWKAGRALWRTRRR